MPVRSLSSAVFRWPEREQALAAARRWAGALRARDAAVERVLCIGSAARGDWGVGSDLDLMVILSDTSLSATQRYAKYYPEDLPVPADLWVYTRAEWQARCDDSPRLHRRLTDEAIELASVAQNGNTL